MQIFLRSGLSSICFEVFASFYGTVQMGYEQPDCTVTAAFLMGIEAHSELAYPLIPEIFQGEYQAFLN